MRQMDEGTKALTFWDHLDVLRSSLIRMAVAVMVLGVVAFCLKDALFSVVLAPRSSDFVTYQLLGVDAFHINLMKVCCWLHLIYYMSCSDSYRQDSTRTSGAMPSG